MVGGFASPYGLTRWGPFVMYSVSPLLICRAFVCGFVGYTRSTLLMRRVVWSAEVAWSE